MLPPFRTLAWILCVIYATIPAFWLLIHPWVKFWRSRRTSPYQILLPCWIAMWIALAAITAPWRDKVLYENRWLWVPAILLFLAGLVLYRFSGNHFSLAQLGGLPEITWTNKPQRLVTTGIRERVRHPIYLAHLCEMLAWSLASGLQVSWTLTVLAILSGTVMVTMEDKELENRFGDEFRQYRSSVPAIIPKAWK